MNMKSYKNILLIGTAIASICAGSPQNKFQDSAYHYLVDDLATKRVYNIPSPLFDSSDPEIQEVYDEAKKSAEPKVIPRDIQSYNDIVNAVERHISHYGDKSLIIISGAGVHIWGAAPTLEDRFDAEYISVTSKKPGLEDIMDNEIYSGNENKSEKIQKTKECIKNQLIRALGVVRLMGYRTLEDYTEDISDFDGAKNIVVGMEETGLHHLYVNKDKKPIYETLTAFTERFKPVSILYVGEDLYSENMRNDFNNGTLPQNYFSGEPDYRTQFLTRAKELKIPVEFASFGK